MTPKDALTPEFREKNEQLDQVTAQARRGRWLMIALVVFAAITIAAFVANALVTFALRTASDANSSEITRIRQDLKTVCRQADTAKLPTSEQDKCFRAEANLPPQSPPTPAAAPTAGRDGRTPTDDQLLILIRGVIASNPPKDGHSPTPEELLALIRPLIPTPIPGVDGVTPSDAQLLVLIRAVYAANPPADGKDGKNAFCYDNPKDKTCQPKNGIDGPKPTGTATFEWDSSGNCMYVVPYGDGSTVKARTQDNLCSSPPSSSKARPIIPTP